MDDVKPSTPLTATDEAICAFFIEDASRLRRIVQFMLTDVDLPGSFLNMLWAYAVKHDRLFDLANALLGFDSNHKTVEGNENCDWFWQCFLPGEAVRANDFFYDLMTYARARAHLARGTYDDWHGSSIAMFEWMEYYKWHDVGKGIIDIENVLDQLLAKYESEVELERRLDIEGQYPNRPEPADRINEVKNPDGRIFVGIFESEVTKDGRLGLPAEFRDELGRYDMCVVRNPTNANTLILAPADFCEKEISRRKKASDPGDDLYEAYKQAVRVKVDERGRMNIPLELLAAVCSENDRKVVLRGYISTIMLLNVSDAPKERSILPFDGILKS
ncbi:MAG: hypothetical protein IJH50_04980 [Kiritimatiellae bacterium]|nr:hypothetical protein [Kiritimatiellia bacterium]